MVGDLVSHGPGQLLCDAVLHKGCPACLHLIQSVPERSLFLLLQNLSYLLHLADYLLEDHKRIPQFVQLVRNPCALGFPLLILPPFGDVMTKGPCVCSNLVDLRFLFFVLDVLSISRTLDEVLRSGSFMLSC